MSECGVCKEICTTDRKALEQLFITDGKFHTYSGKFFLVWCSGKLPFLRK